MSVWELWQLVSPKHFLRIRVSSLPSLWAVLWKYGWRRGRLVQGLYWALAITEEDGTGGVHALFNGQSLGHSQGQPGGQHHATHHSSGVGIVSRASGVIRLTWSPSPSSKLLVLYANQVQLLYLNYFSYYVYFSVLNFYNKEEMAALSVFKLICSGSSATVTNLVRRGFRLNCSRSLTSSNQGQ